MTMPFRGSYSVIVTPFSEDGSAICVPSLKRFLDWQLKSRVSGIIILGTTGEFLALDDEDRQVVIETTVKHVAGQVPILVGTTNAYTPTAVRYSREAEALGADGLMIVPPYYYTPTDEEIVKFYRAISEAVSIPIMLYNNPFTSNVDMSAELVAKLTKELGNVRYIKEASQDLGRVHDIVRLTKGEMSVFAGERPVESFLLGAVGYVNPYGNYLPYSTSRLWDYLIEGKIEAASAIQEMLHKIDKIIAAGHPTYGHQCYSKALSAAQGYPMGDVRPPLTQFRELGQDGKRRLGEVQLLCDEIDKIVARIDGKSVGPM